MGSCLFKEKARVTTVSTDHTIHGSSVRSADEGTVNMTSGTMDPLEQLIIDTLCYISSTHERDEPPAPTVRINEIAETEEGWCSVMCAVKSTVPPRDPLGPSAIMMVFDECPLPARDTVLGFVMSLDINEDRCLECYRATTTRAQERNLLILLGCIAEKFAGVDSERLFTENIRDYLVKFLVDQRDPGLVLHALLTLEKFSATASNKNKIEDCLKSLFFYPLLNLETTYQSTLYAWKQVGFVARWALDNIFFYPARRFPYEVVDMSHIHVILNNDMSEYLKISPDGLEARCDSNSFESVRATFQVDRGCWYYEASLVTAGVMQIGWATKNASFQNHEGYGVGDDPFSIAYDGCRRLTWYRGHGSFSDTVPSWKPGDIVGCLIDVDRQEAIFSLNGVALPVCTLKNKSEAFYAAASFMSHQHCKFNFGSKQFRYPPKDRTFKSMNDYGVLTSEDKKVIPRRILRQELDQPLRRLEHSCAVCLDEEGTYALMPCFHGLFCSSCVRRLVICPFCRRLIKRCFISFL